MLVIVSGAVGKIRPGDPEQSRAARTIKGRLVGPAPQTVSAYVVLLEDDSLYISSSIYPLPSSLTPKPKFRMDKKAPLGSVRALLVPSGCADSDSADLAAGVEAFSFATESMQAQGAAGVQAQGARRLQACRLKVP